MHPTAHPRPGPRSRLPDVLRNIARRWHALSLALLLAWAAAPASAALSVSVQANPTPAMPNESVLLRFTVSNSDGFDRSGVVMRMVYPAGLANLPEGLIERGACDDSVIFNSTCEATEAVIWNLGTVRAGQSVTVTMPPVVAAGTLPGTVILFEPEVSDDFGATDSAGQSVEVINSRALQLSLNEVTQTPVPSGAALSYQLSFGHTASSSVATNATLEMPVPAGFSFVSASDGGSLSGAVVRWTLGTLLPGQVGERRVHFTVAGTAPEGSVIETEAVLSADGGKLAQSDLLTRIEAEPGLLLALDADSNPAAPGEALDASLTVSNPGFFDRSDVVVSLRYPVGMDNLSESLVEAGQCDDSVIFNSTCEPREMLVWTLGTVRAGESISVRWPPSIAAATLPGAILPLEATVVDSAGASARANETVAVVNSRVLQLGMHAVTQTPVQPGGPLTLQLSFGHTASSSVSTQATLSLPVPHGLSFVSASDGGTVNNGIVRWTLGTLLPGQVGERRVSFAVANNVPEGHLIEAEAVLGADGGKIVRADLLTTVQARPGLALALDIDSNPAVPGDVLDAKLTVSNTSFFDRSGVVVSLRYPVGLSNLSEGLVEGGQCDDSVIFNSTCEPREMLLWTLGTLRAGKSITVALPPSVATATLPGTVIAFTAVVADSSGSSAWTSEAVEVVNSRVLQLDLSEVTQEPALPGQALTYRLSFGHTASSAVAAGTVLELPVPTGLHAVSATGGGVLSGGVVRWTLGNLNPAQAGTRDVRFDIDPLDVLSTGQLAKLEATLRDTSGALVQANDTTRLESEAPLALGLQVAPNPRLPGEAVDVSLSVTNESAFTRNNVVLRIAIPEGLASLPEGLIDGGTCDDSVIFNSTCEPLETLEFNLGTLPAGATVLRGFTATVNPSAAEGSLIEFASWVEDATARSRATQTLRVGVGASCDAFGGDSDGDGVCDAGPQPDNCTFLANADQRDTNGDGFGNRCDADLDNNGLVTVADLGRFKLAFGSIGAGLDADFNGDGVVNNTDLAIFKSLFGKPPGPSGQAGRR